MLLDVPGFIASLGLSDGCRVDQRVPKKLLLENGAPTAADKRLIADAVEEIQWVAALKPNTIGVPDYRDDQRVYLEIAVLAVTLRSQPGQDKAKPANAARLAELVHRAVPYPVLLLLCSGQSMTLSFAHKRWAQNEASKVVLDGGMVSMSLPEDAPSLDALTAFVQAIALTRQPRSSLFALYQGWMDSAQALLAAKLTGTFKTADSAEQAAARRHALQECERLESEAAHLRTQAGKEKQIARQVELNLALKRVLAQLAAARQQL
ncbi:DUF4391 domain-containing protein [Pseudomonas aeruginosa]|uniref:DUF4391 domain-containing protein n=1 Tax=Pseudomonas aeruginosa TaxID=287 RepID=UPI002B25713A|nr:DUF4391 domain-containing protein [Pseudomonas aeruginosa]EKX7257448.1 DUF4391 domain-containing protein [Pseudomonas aeruginosa]WOX90175.1 DUF4391 domain-containing protein [Pseudomonas aeruginosa]